MATSRQVLCSESRELSTGEVSEIKSKALLKDVFRIAKLKQSKSSKLDDALKELIKEHGSLRGFHVS